MTLVLHGENKLGILSSQKRDCPASRNLVALTAAQEAQPPVAVLRPITSIVGNNKSLSCKVGERPEPSAYPSVVLVAYPATELSHEQTELPIRWNLDSVNFDAAGIYTVKGSFTEDVLAVHHLSNPNGISPTLIINVQETGAVKAPAGNIISVGRDGLCLIRLTVPSLPSDVEITVGADRVRANVNSLFKSSRTKKKTFLPLAKNSGEKIPFFTLSRRKIVRA